MDYWPLRDLAQTIRDCDRSLADLVYQTEALLGQTEGQYPAEGRTLLDNVAALRELLPHVIPPALQTQIDAEEAQYAEEEAKWDVHQANNYRG